MSINYLENVFGQFNNTKNIWINDGKKEPIHSKHKLYEWLTTICYKIYKQTPKFNNELINKQVTFGNY